MKVELDVSNVELTALEDALTTWCLCEKHNRQVDKLSEVAIFKKQQDCNDCMALLKKERNKAIHVWSKLAHAYQIARHGKCGCGKR